MLSTTLRKFEEGDRRFLHSTISVGAETDAHLTENPVITHADKLARISVQLATISG